MLTPPANLMIYVATQPVDFRKGGDGCLHTTKTAGLSHAREHGELYDGVA